MKIKPLIAACAAMVAVGAASAGAVPGGSLGSLTATPSNFSDFWSPLTSGAFSDSFTFSVGANSTVTGSVAAYTLGLSFSQILLDGVAVTPTLVHTDYGFSFANVGVGSHTLTVTGLDTGGGLNAYSGSVYSTPSAVPEPESLALVLGGLGIVGMVARRRQQVR